MQLQSLLHELFLKGPANCFDAFITECQKWYETPAHSLVEIRARNNTKLRGDIFEVFCVLYLQQSYDDVWRLEDVPDEILTNLKMKRKDMGIDLVARKGQLYSAVQCKYKKPTGRKSCITWKALSTFYALCLRTGPWDKYIVMTNCDYTRRVGEKTEKDVSICLKTFQGITKEKWIAMCGVEGHVMAEAAPLSQDELRAARLKYFSPPHPGPAAP
jgi:hypothetical protein